MATVQDELAKVNQRLDAVEALVDPITTAIAGITDDVAFLKEELAKIGSGELTPEQQAAFDAVNARLDAMTPKLATAKTNAEALDAATSRT